MASIDTAAADMATVVAINLNGTAYQAASCELASLVDALSLRGQMIAVAINRRIIAASDWPVTRLQPGDRVDIVRAIGGG